MITPVSGWVSRRRDADPDALVGAGGGHPDVGQHHVRAARARSPRTACPRPRTTRPPPPWATTPAAGWSPSLTRKLSSATTTRTAMELTLRHHRDSRRDPWAAQRSRSSAGPKSCLRSERAWSRLRRALGGSSSEIRTTTRSGCEACSRRAVSTPSMPGHPHVDQDQLWLRVRHDSQRLLARADLAGGLEAGGGLHDRARGRAEHCLVVDGHHADRNWTHQMARVDGARPRRQWGVPVSAGAVGTPVIRRCAPLRRPAPQPGSW